MVRTRPVIAQTVTYIYSYIILRSCRPECMHMAIIGTESDDEIASTQDDINGVLNELLVKTIVATPPVSYIIISCIVLLPGRKPHHCMHV